MNTTTSTDREGARALLASAGAHWHAAITSTNAPHYQAALDRIAQLMADSRELAAVRERAALASIGGGGVSDQPTPSAHIDARDELASAVREVLMVAIPSGDPGGASMVSASAMHSLRAALASIETPR